MKVRPVLKPMLDLPGIPSMGELGAPSEKADATDWQGQHSQVPQDPSATEASHELLSKLSVESILKEAGADLDKADLDKIVQKFREQGLVNNKVDNHFEVFQTLKNMTDADLEYDGCHFKLE